MMDASVVAEKPPHVRPGHLQYSMENDCFNNKLVKPDFPKSIYLSDEHAWLWLEQTHGHLGTTAPKRRAEASEIWIARRRAIPGLGSALRRRRLRHISMRHGTRTTQEITNEAFCSQGRHSLTSLWGAWRGELDDREVVPEHFFTQILASRLNFDPSFSSFLEVKDILVLYALPNSRNESAILDALSKFQGYANAQGSLVDVSAGPGIRVCSLSTRRRRRFRTKKQ